MPPTPTQENGDSVADDSNIRSLLGAAIDEAEGSNESGAAPAPAPAEAAAPAAAPVAQAPAPAPAAAPAAQAPAPGAAPAPAAQAPAAAPAGEFPQAPGSWTPTAREQWNAVSPAIRAEVWKREREVSTALTQSAEARRFANEFNQTIQPFLGFIAAENSTPLTAVRNMMNTAAILRVGTAQQKCEAVAGIIKGFGVDLAALDAVLAGQQPEFNTPQHQQQTMQQMINQALAPLMQRLQMGQQQIEQSAAQGAESDLQSFMVETDPDGKLKHEFYNDVRHVMADVMEVAQRHGQNISLTEAYERAILLHDPVRRVIEGRRQTEAANAANARARQARGSAVSVSPSVEAAAQAPAPGNSIRSALEFSIANTEGQR